MRFLARLYLVMLLSLGLLLPRVSVMLADLTGAGHVVLCDGSALVVLSQDDGQTRELTHSDPCALVAADLPALPGPLRLLRAAGEVRYLRRRSQRAALCRAGERQRSRAPPAV